ANPTRSKTKRLRKELRRRSRAARPSRRVGRSSPAGTAGLDGWSPNRAPRGAGEQDPAYRPARPPSDRRVTPSVTPVRDGVSSPGSVRQPNQRRHVDPPAPNGDPSMRRERSWAVSPAVALLIGGLLLNLPIG